MCGIAGFTHESRLVDVCAINRMTASLSHRGPDDSQTLVLPGVCLGSVRLAVIDPAAGAQPLRSHDGWTVVAFNGEIYNHRELRVQLESHGVRFRSNCDTEVVLEAFRQWGTDSFRRLRGMFAVALWDNRESRLFLARDHSGIKPLYFARQSNHIYFGSEMKAIFAHGAIRRVLNEQALEDYLSLNYVPGAQTLIRGIEKLPAGHYLEWQAGAARIYRYWTLNTTPDASWTSHDAERRLDSLLQSSVREQMVADRPLGIWSSGGLDSSTVLHYAAQQSSARLNTFSVGFGARCCDETPYFRLMAEQYGTTHHEMQLAPGPHLLNAIQEFATYSDEPNADAGALPVWFLSQMTAGTATVALSGDGGDELFGGYLTYMADQAARPLRLIPRAARKAGLRLLCAALPCSAKKISFEYKLKRLLEGSLMQPDDAHLFWNGAFTPAQKCELLGRKSWGPNLFHALPEAHATGALNRYMFLDQKYYLTDNILAKVDRMSMAHSLEVRPPLLDHRIVEFAASLPQNLKIRGTEQKLVLRRLMRGKLPDSILRRPKKGFDIPAHDWFRGFLRPLLEDTVNRQTIEASGLFNFAATERLIRDHMNRRINAGYQLWGLLTLFLWLKRWDVEIAPVEDFSIAAFAPELSVTS